MHYPMLKHALLAAGMIPLLCSAAHARNAHDNVLSQGNPIVTSTYGECVRTRWQADNDICAPTPPPPPPVVVQPAPPPPPPPKIMIDQRTIYFDFNKSTLTSEAIAKLNTLVTIIHRSQAIRSATVLGYADEIGSDSYNMELSQQRATAVQEYIASYVSIPTNVLMVSGKGESASITDCPKSMKRADRVACLAKDRRVEIEFNYVQQPTR